MFRLDNKITLVTGASSGIGRAIAETFAKAGAFVYVADRDAGGGQETVKRISAAGVKAAFLALDVTKRTNAKRRVGRCMPRTAVSMCSSTMRVLVTSGPFFKPRARTSTACIPVNVRGMFNVTRAFPDMVKRKSAMSSISPPSVASSACAIALAYCTTKFAVVGFTKSMALDHALDGIRVNCICPGRLKRLLSPRA